MIKITNACFSYRNKPILSQFNLVIPDCGLTILDQQSGFGKTTLARILVGELHLKKGSITGLKGKKIVYLRQNPALLLRETVRTNLSLGDKISQELIEKFSVLDYLDFSCDSLSEGTKQKVAFLRALFQDGDLYIFDEPMQFLDEESKSLVDSLILELSKSKAVLLITHESFSSSESLTSTSYVENQQTPTLKKIIYPYSFTKYLFSLLSILFILLPFSMIVNGPLKLNNPYSNESQYRAMEVPLTFEKLETLSKIDYDLYSKDKNATLVFPLGGGSGLIQSFSKSPTILPQSILREKNITLDNSKYYITKNYERHFINDFLSSADNDDGQFGSNTLPYWNFSYSMRIGESFKFGGFIEGDFADAIYIDDYYFYSEKFPSFSMDDEFISLTEGRKPQQFNEVLITEEGKERLQQNGKSYEIGEVIEMVGLSFTIVGHGQNHVTDRSNVFLQNTYDDVSGFYIVTPDCAKALMAFRGQRGYTVVTDEKTTMEELGFTPFQLSKYKGYQSRIELLITFIAITLVIGVIITFITVSARSIRALKEAGISAKNLIKQGMSIVTKNSLYYLSSALIIGLFMELLISPIATFAPNVLVILVGVILMTCLVSLVQIAVLCLDSSRKK